MLHLHLHTPKDLGSMLEPSESSWKVLLSLSGSLNVIMVVLYHASSLQVLLCLSLKSSLSISFPCWDGTPINEDHSLKGKVSLENNLFYSYFSHGRSSLWWACTRTKEEGFVKDGRVDLNNGWGRCHFSLELHHALWGGDLQGPLHWASVRGEDDKLVE